MLLFTAMLTVIEIDKKQYLVKKDETIEVQLLEQTEGEISIDKVLLVIDDDNRVTIGTPYINDAVVKAQVLGQEKGDKVVIYKYKRRKKYRRKTGHRQKYTVLKISDIIIPTK